MDMQRNRDGKGLHLFLHRASRDEGHEMRVIPDVGTARTGWLNTAIAVSLTVIVSSKTVVAQDIERDRAMPPSEASVIDIVEHAAKAFDASRSKAELDRLRRDRATQLCAAMPLPVVTEWIGSVVSYVPGEDGLVTFEFRLSPHLTVGSYNDAAADAAAHNDTRLSETMPDLRDGWRPRPGQSVTISGIFDKGGADCWENMSRTPETALSDPDFAFHVTALMPQ